MCVLGGRGIAAHPDCFQAKVKALQTRFTTRGGHTTELDEGPGNWKQGSCGQVSPVLATI